MYYSFWSLSLFHVYGWYLLDVFFLSQYLVEYHLGLRKISRERDLENAEIYWWQGGGWIWASCFARDSLWIAPQIRLTLRGLTSYRENFYVKKGHNMEAIYGACVARYRSLRATFSLDRLLCNSGCHWLGIVCPRPKPLPGRREVSWATNKTFPGLWLGTLSEHLRGF